MITLDEMSRIDVEKHLMNIFSDNFRKIWVQASPKSIMVTVFPINTVTGYKILRTIKNDDPTLVDIENLINEYI